ncbi:MAG: transposase, partial [Acidimicrobiales bacterium]
MYLRTIQRRNKDGSVVRYVQLAHNVRHAETGSPVAEVIHSFGREDHLDRQALGRLVRSIARYLGPEAELVSEASASGEALSFVSSKALGGAWALDGLWRRLGIDRTMNAMLAGRRLDPRVERVIFALVANRALEPLSKLAATRWVGERVALPGLDTVDDDACYRAM